MFLIILILKILNHYFIKSIIVRFRQSNPPSTPIVIVEKADEIIDDNNKNDDMIYEENINNNPKGNALTEMNEKSIVPTDISSTNTADYNHTANTDNATSNELIQNAEQDMDTSALDKPDGEASNCNGHMDSSEEGEHFLLFKSKTANIYLISVQRIFQIHFFCKIVYFLK